MSEQNRAVSWRAWKYCDGKWNECDSVSIADRGFRYGMSIFETVAVRNTRGLFVDGHIQRLSDSLVRLAWDTGFSCKAAVTEFFSLTKLEDGVVRIFITAGEGAPLDPPHEHALYALWENVPFPDESELQKGFTVCSIREFTKTGFAGMKTGNYWGNIHALQEARRQKADECLILDAHGVLVGAAMANVFLYAEGCWHTPKLHTGARDGVIREWIIERGSAAEKEMHHADVQSAEEIVIANSRIGVMPVCRCDGKELQMRHGRELSAVYLRDIVHA